MQKIARHRTLPGSAVRQTTQEEREQKRDGKGTTNRSHRSVLGGALLLALLLGITAKLEVRASEGELPAVVTAGGDHAIKHWDSKGTLVSTIGRHTDTVTAILSVPIQKDTLISAGADGVLQIWKI